MEICPFCQIVQGKAPCHRIWEDDEHLAFLSIYPNTEGVSVVIPKQHYASDAFALPDAVLQKLIVAVKRVAHLLNETLEDVGRTGMVFEGFGVDHVHAKLFPMHGTASLGTWAKRSVSRDVYFPTYKGYISSHDYKQANDAALAALAKKIRSRA